VGEFSAGIRRYVDGVKVDVDRQVRGITLALFKSVIVGTPVDTGRARGNWQTSIGAPEVGVVDRLDPSGAAAIGEVRKNMGGVGHITWLANNLPYIEKLEYGGYPEGPNTVGGFSRQAPAGMVRINMARIDGIIRENGGLPTRRRKAK
jgi:hypothetical protein